MTHQPPRSGGRGKPHWRPSCVRAVQDTYQRASGLSRRDLAPARLQNGLEGIVSKPLDLTIGVAGRGIGSSSRTLRRLRCSGRRRRVGLDDPSRQVHRRAARTYRDRKDLALLAAQVLKSRNSNTVVGERLAVRRRDHHRGQPKARIAGTSPNYRSGRGTRDPCAPPLNLNPASVGLFLFRNSPCRCWPAGPRLPFPLTVRPPARNQS